MNRSLLIKLLTFLGGIYFFLEFYLPGEETLGFDFNKYHEQITLGYRIIGAMAIGLGVINIFQIHLKKVLLLLNGWVNSLALLLGFAVMIAAGTYEWQQSINKQAVTKNFLMLSSFAEKIALSGELQKLQLITPELTFYQPDLSLISAENQLEASNLNQKLKRSQGTINRQLSISPSAATTATATGLSKSLSTYATTTQQLVTLQHYNSFAYELNEYLYNGFFVALGSAMFSLLAFYVASAAYRAFQIRSVESGLMMTAAIVVMLGQIPFGLWIWSGFPEVRFFLLTQVSSAAFRAITVGAGIAGLIIALRMWLSIESDFNTKRS